MRCCQFLSHVHQSFYRTFDLVDVLLECHSLPLSVSLMVSVPPKTNAKHHTIETWKDVLNRLSNHICLSDNLAVKNKI